MVTKDVVDWATIVVSPKATVPEVVVGTGVVPDEMVVDPLG